MQNKLFRGLFISLFALTLTACVGAVTIGDTSPESALISRCIMNDNANDASCATVVEENPCITNPFGVACDITFANYYKTAQANRINFCSIANNANYNICNTAVAEHPCIADPFIAGCNTNRNFANYYKTAQANRTSFCRKNININLCAGAIKNVCDKNPFNISFCFRDNTYYQTQKIMCESEPTSLRCRDTLNRVCEENVFDALCTGISRYENERETVCKRDRNLRRCAPTLERVCGGNVFDALCTRVKAYYPARELACINEPDSERCTLIFTAQERACNREPNSEQCAPTLSRVCGANLFDELCEEAKAHFTAQETACASEPNSERCVPIVARSCGKSAFDSLCQSRNLTLRDLPEIPDNPSWQATSINFRSISGNSPSGGCDSSIDYRRLCWANIPQIISIKPLNNTNTGTATYAGSVSLKYLFDSREVKSLNKNIDIIANFDNNTLSYSSNLERHHNENFNINGRFTDRGFLTGTVNYRGWDVDLRGLIGQNEVMGVFATGGSSSSKSFAGGFKATRE